MSCSIPKKTTGYITIEHDKWEEFKVAVKDMSPEYVPGNSILIEEIGSLFELVPEFVDTNDHNDAINHCDEIEFGQG